MGKIDITVDEFVKTRVLPELQPVVAMLRGVLRACAPDAREIMSYGIPAYRGRKIFAVISPTKRDITLAFSRGAEFEDGYALLTGVGKVSKNLKCKNVEDVNQEALRYYIKQALELDTS